MSSYYLEHASVNHLQKHFDFFEAEARSLLGLGLAIPAYVLFFKIFPKLQVSLCSSDHLLCNMLGMISF